MSEITVKTLRQFIGQSDEVSCGLYYGKPYNRIVTTCEGGKEIIIWDSESGTIEKKLHKKVDELPCNMEVILKWNHNTFLAFGGDLSEIVDNDGRFYQYEFSIEPPFSCLSKKVYTKHTSRTETIPLYPFLSCNLKHHGKEVKDLYLSINVSSLISAVEDNNQYADDDETTFYLRSRESESIVSNLGKFPDSVDLRNVRSSCIKRNVLYYFIGDYFHTLRVRNYESNEDLVFKLSKFRKTSSYDSYLNKFGEEIVVAGCQLRLEEHDAKRIINNRLFQRGIFFFNTGTSFEDLKERLKEEGEDNMSLIKYVDVSNDVLIRTSLVLQNKYLFIGGENCEFSVYSLGNHFDTMFIKKKNDEQNSIELPPIFTTKLQLGESAEKIKYLKDMKILEIRGMESSCTFLCYSTDEEVKSFEICGLTQLGSNESDLKEKDLTERISFLLSVSGDEDVVFSSSKKKLVLDIKLQNDFVLNSVWKLLLFI